MAKEEQAQKKIENGDIINFYHNDICEGDGYGYVYCNCGNTVTINDDFLKKTYICDCGLKLKFSNYPDQVSSKTIINLEPGDVATDGHGEFAEVQTVSGGTAKYYAHLEGEYLDDRLESGETVHRVSDLHKDYLADDENDEATMPNFENFGDTTTCRVVCGEQQACNDMMLHLGEYGTINTLDYKSTNVINNHENFGFRYCPFCGKKYSELSDEIIAEVLQDARVNEKMLYDAARIVNAEEFDRLTKYWSDCRQMTTASGIEYAEIGEDADTAELIILAK